MSLEIAASRESDPDEFSFRRVMAALSYRFEKALDLHNRNPDYRMFTMMPPAPEREEYALARVRLAPRTVVEGDLQAVAGNGDSYFDVGLPLENASTENPELAQLGARGFFILFNEPSAQHGVLVDIDTIHLLLPNDFADAVRDEMVAIPMRQRPFVD